jgi:hypothetical protein
MPYMIDKVKGGYKVCRRCNKSPCECLSNKALTKKTATKQRIAVAISESKKYKKPVSSYFM